MSIRILVVDDSPAMRAFIRKAIQMSGLDVLTVHEASNGLEALSCMANFEVDLVLCDVNMPEMNGEQFLENLGFSGDGSGISVVIVSTDATTTRVQRLRELGAREYLRKPFSPEELRTAIDSALEVTHA